MISCRIKDIARINSRSLPEGTDPEMAFRYIDISAVDEFGRVSIPDENTTFANAPSRARRLAPPGAVVVSTVRTYLRAIATVPPTNSTLVFSTGFAVLEATDKVDSRFLGYYCRSQLFVDEVVARSVGVSYPAINASDIGNIPITLPPLEEQRRIADFLDAETARIDGILLKRDQQLSALSERIVALISEGLIPGILTAPAKRPPWPWLPETLHDRPLTKLGYVSRLQHGLTVDGQRRVDGDVVTRPYLRVANVQAGKLDLEAVSEITVPRRVAERSTLRSGDVLMTEGGDLDKLGRGTVWRDEIPGCLHQNHVFAIRPDRDRLVPEYLAYMTQTVHGRCYFESTGSRTTNLASTNSHKIMAFPVPLPPVRVQREVVAELRAAIEHSERAKAAIERQRSLLRERRQALITAAVTGQIEVATAGGRRFIRII